MLLLLLLLVLLLSMWMLSLLNATMLTARWNSQLLAMWLGCIVCRKERRQSLVEWVWGPTTFTFLQLLEVLPQSGLTRHLRHGTAATRTISKSSHK